MKRFSKTKWAIVICGLLFLLVVMRGCYNFLGRARQGIQGGPNTLLCLLNYEDKAVPKSAHARFVLVNSISIVPFQSDPVHHTGESDSDAQGKLSIVWYDNSGLWLNDIEADGQKFTFDQFRTYRSRGGADPFWQGYIVGSTTDRRSTTAIAVHYIAEVTLNRANQTYTVEHIRDDKGP